MATNVTTPDYFEIGISAFNHDPYAKNSATQWIGGYASRQQYVWEMLSRPNLSGIPGGSTINSVTVSVNVIGNNNPSPLELPLSIHVQDKGSWTDDGSTTPRSGTAPFTNFDAYPAALSFLNIVGSETGIKVLPSTPALVSWFQGVLDGGTTNDGLVVTYYPDYFSYYLIVNVPLTFTVDYTEGGGPSARRRIMIIS